MNDAVKAGEISIKKMKQIAATIIQSDIAEQLLLIKKYLPMKINISTNGTSHIQSWRR